MPKFQSALVYDKSFSRYNGVENRKCTELPQNDLKHLTAKSVLYTMNNHPRPKFQPVSVYDKSFSSYNVVEIENAPNGPRMTLST